MDNHDTIRARGLGVVCEEQASPRFDYRLNPETLRECLSWSERERLRVCGERDYYRVRLRSADRALRGWRALAIAFVALIAFAVLWAVAG